MILQQSVRCTVFQVPYFYYAHISRSSETLLCVTKIVIDLS